MKLLAPSLALCTALALLACGSGDAEPITDGETAGTVDLSNEGLNPAPTLGSGVNATGNVTANETMDAIRGAGGLTGLSPNEAVINIDEWIVKLSSLDGTDALVANLRQLKTQLTGGELDGDRVGALLRDIGAETQRLATGNAAVSGLGSALESAGAEMAGQ